MEARYSLEADQEPTLVRSQDGKETSEVEGNGVDRSADHLEQCTVDRRMKARNPESSMKKGVE